MPRYVFSNVMGCFVFDEKYYMIDHVLFDSSQKYLEKEKTEASSMLKNKASLATEKEQSNILSKFRDAEYFPEFLKKNLELTRAAIKASVGNDTLIIQTISGIEEIDRSVNTLAKRLREWYAYYAPEIENNIEDHEKFANYVLKNNKNQALKDFGIKDSIGGELKSRDIEPIMLLASEVSGLFSVRQKYQDYLKKMLDESCPNATIVLGPMVMAKLIEKAGSLRRLALLPASTIQILGAEKALFRHMKNSKNLPPKYGFLHEHQLIQKAKRDMHGRIARALADKASIAIKVDYFKGKPIGEKLKKELISRFRIEY